MTGEIYPATPRALRRSDIAAAAVAVLGFPLRAWLAQATFFNTDEAWHFAMANQDSLRHAYHASLTLAHPPLLIFVLYFWRLLGTSNLVLRLPGVFAGALFCWTYYKWLDNILGRTAAWIGLLFVTFLPTMIAVSAELRQYPFLLFFCSASGYLLERAFARNSAGLVLLSSACLYLAMLSHYSAFLFAASIGVYGLWRLLKQPFSRRMTIAWIASQAVGVGVAVFLYRTHIAKLGAVYTRGEPLHRFADWYLAKFYYHPAQDHLLPFLFRGTFGIFRLAFAWVVMGHIATLLFVAGIVLLIRCKIKRGNLSESTAKTRLTGVLLLLPFALDAVAVTAGLYPYGRTRQCMILAIFGIAGVSVALARIVKEKLFSAVPLVLCIILLCHIFGSRPDRDMLPFAEQRHEHMDQAIEYIHSRVSPATDVIFLDQSTAYQVAHYLCRQKPVVRDHSVAGFESFQCDGIRVITTFPVDDALQVDTFPIKLREMEEAFGLNAGNHIWIVQGGWASGLGEALRIRYPEFQGVEPYSFGHYMEIFRLQ